MLPGRTLGKHELQQKQDGHDTKVRYVNVIRRKRTRLQLSG